MHLEIPRDNQGHTLIELSIVLLLNTLFLPMFFIISNAKQPIKDPCLKVSNKISNIHNLANFTGERITGTFKDNSLNFYDSQNKGFDSYSLSNDLNITGNFGNLEDNSQLKFYSNKMLSPGSIEIRDLHHKTICQINVSIFGRLTIDETS